MNSEKAVEAIYEIEAVEGVAWFENQGELSVNQLSISEEAVEKMGQVLYEMRAGLKGAERALKGLLMRTENQTFMCYLRGTVLVLLEIDSSANIDKIYTKLKSQLGAIPEEEPVAVPATEAAAVVQGDPDDGLPVRVEEFVKILTSMMKKVAPVQMAKKMIAEGQAESGITHERTGLSFDEAATFGTKVTDKIPNAARRKMLKKELQASLDNLQK